MHAPPLVGNPSFNWYAREDFCSNSPNQIGPPRSETGRHRPGHRNRATTQRIARLVGGDSEYESLVARVVGFVEAPSLGLDLPLDVRGTAFQQRVWQALRDIPTGQTISYSEIARKIGTPKAVRAVAGACAANNIALAIPCHRVVRNDGSISGYAWGIERKRALIEREAVPLKKTA